MALVGTVILALLATAHSAPPLTQEQATQASVRLEKLLAFVEATTTYTVTQYFIQCKNNSKVYTDQCGSVSENSCAAPYECQSDGVHEPDLTDQSSCEAYVKTSTPGSWGQRFAKRPQNRCCSDGSKECKSNEAGNEVPCCNYAAASYNGEGFTGASVCGTAAGVCSVCTQDRELGGEWQCTSKGSCSATVHSGTPGTPSQACAEHGGTWTPYQWTVNTSAVTEAACYAEKYCAICKQGDRTGTHNSYAETKADCEQAGWCSNNHDLTTNNRNPPPCEGGGGVWAMGVWEKDTSIATESECTATHGGFQGEKYHWKKGGMFESGNPIPAHPMHLPSGGCSTGPSHTLDGLVDGLSGAEQCANETQFLADAEAGLTVEAALAASPWYYTMQMHKMMGPGSMTFRPIVTNNDTAGVVDRAKITIANTACFTPLVGAKNKGSVVFENGTKTSIMVVNPTNYAEAEMISIRGGTARVLGGTNAGAINIATYGKIELYGLVNSGPVTVSLSQDIVIANVVNNVGGAITAIDVSATLINVVNHATVTVKGPVSGPAQGGFFNGYDIVNTGTVIVEAGVVNIASICPTSGTVTVSAGVTGVVTYETGCMGTINGDVSGVTITEIEKQQTVISGTAGMSVPDADAFLTDTVAQQAVSDGIADTAGVPTGYVAIQVAKVRRLNDDHERRLAGTAVTITYTITIPVSVSSATASAASAKMAAVTPTQLTTKIAAKVTAAKGSSFVVSVTSKAVPAVAKMAPPPTTTTIAAGTTAGNGTSIGSSSAGSASHASGVIPSFCVMTLFLAVAAWAK